MLFQLLRGGYSGKEIVFYLLIMLFALTLSFSIHEFMHAFTAYKLGDPTAKNLGRVTLNPAAHVDPMGVILLLIAGFGWGKPVPVNSSRLNRLKNKRLMAIMVHLAGVTGNFILAFVSRLISLFLVFAFNYDRIESSPALYAVFLVLSFTDSFSMGLLAFNLLPVPPLDGFHVLEELLPYKVKYSNGYRNFLRYGPQVLLILIIVGRIGSRSILSFVLDIIQIPFEILLNILLLPFGWVLGLFF